MARETMQERLETLGAKVEKLREKDEKWAAIAEATGVSSGKCMLAYLFVTTPDKDRIKFRNDEELTVKIVKARESNVSWGKIMARAGVTEGKARTLWEQSAGESSRGRRVGKGGRHIGEDSPKKVATPKTKGISKAKGATKAAEAKAAAAKKAPAVKKAAAPAKETTAARKTAKPKVDILTADCDSLVEFLDGRKIRVLSAKTGKETVYAVKTVKSADETNFSIIDAKSGGERTFARSSVKGVSK